MDKTENPTFDTARARAALDAALVRLNCSLSAEKCEMLLKHLALVLEKNRTLNLTRIVGIEEAVQLHIEDSLAVLDEFSMNEGEFCDIGTGAGFPGIPLGIATGRKGTLLDSISKKARAVQDFVEELGISDSLYACAERSEEHARLHAGIYGTVIARAVASTPTVLELATPLLMFDGTIVVMKAVEEDLDGLDPDRIEEILGLELIHSRAYRIGENGHQRRSLVFKKVKEPCVSLPRRPGMAAKRPVIG